MNFKQDSEREIKKREKQSKQGRVSVIEPEAPTSSWGDLK